jgi:hypothetical protein
MRGIALLPLVADPSFSRSEILGCLAVTYFVGRTALCHLSVNSNLRLVWAISLLGAEFSPKRYFSIGRQNC